MGPLAHLIATQSLCCIPSPSLHAELHILTVQTTQLVTTGLRIVNAIRYACQLAIIDCVPILLRPASYATEIC